MRLELFGCAGGMAEGFRRAGIPFDMVVDANPDACDSYAANHGLRPVQMDVRDLLRMVRLGWRPVEEIELLVADPPCAPWSPTGNREGLADERDMMRETCELVQTLEPAEWMIAKGVIYLTSDRPRGNNLPSR